jgi:hypothetical protein
MEIAGYGKPFLAAIDHGLAVHPEDRPQTIADWRREMGPTPSAASAIDALSEASPAAARTRLMQAPLTQLGKPLPALRLGGADESERPRPATSSAVRSDAAAAAAPALRLGGVDEDARVRPAAPPRRRGRRGFAAVSGLVVLLTAGGLYGWQAYFAVPRDSGPAPTSTTPSSAKGPAPAAVPPSPPPPTSPSGPPSPPPTASPTPPPLLPPEVRLPPPKGDPVPVPPASAPGQPGGTVGSIDDLLRKGGAPSQPGTAVRPDIKAARDKTLDAVQQAASRAQAAAERAERARQLAMQRAGDARIRAAEAGKPDLVNTQRTTFDDGSTYVGQMVDGKRDGLGVAVLRAGERQAGEWKGDRLEGLGMLRAGDGRGYEGEWRGGLPNGAGVFRLGSEERYFGEVKDGQPQGAGVRIVGDGRDTTTRAGFWQNGTLEGPAVETTTSGWRYEGGFRGGKRHGPGLLIAPDGMRFHGMFVDGLADGYGVSVAPDGSMSSGEWRAGKLTRADE